MKIGERIRMMRVSLGITQPELAEKCGWSEGQARISNYENNVREPEAANVIILSRVFKVSPGWLLFGEEHGSQKISLSKIDNFFHSIPIIEPDYIEDWIKNNILQPNSKEINLIGLSKQLGKKSFVMPVIGDAMVSKDIKLSLSDGDKVVVDPDEVLMTGCIVVVLIKSSEVKIRQYQKDGNSRILKAFDPQYPVINMSSEIEIMGVVKQRITYF